MSAKWMPNDVELDEVARSLPPMSNDARRVEETRTALLARAAAMQQQTRRSRMPLFAAAGALAAAAALVLWVARPAEESHPRETITSIGSAHYERITAWPDFVVRLDDGRIDITVAKLANGERFRAKTVDAEVEVRGTRFIVGADHGKLTLVAVAEGSVEVRWEHESPVFVAAGQTWTPTKIAQHDHAQPTTPTASTTTSIADTRTMQEVATPTTSTSQPTAATKPEYSKTGRGVKAVKSPISTAVTTSKQPASTASSAATETATPTTATTPTTTTSTAAASMLARPGEADFRAGIASLRSGDAAAATLSFTRACTAAQNDALGEDACFWRGAAAKRAGQASTAREALTRFLETYPSSGRAGEASALLGWLLYDAGELDAAQQRFEVAARDRVPKVKESASRGVEAIKRKRATR